MLKPRNISFLMAMLLLFPGAASAEDHAFGVGQLEPQLKILEWPPRDVTGDQLRDLPLSDPRLRAAYFWLIKCNVSELADTRYPDLVEVLKDVRRRGDSTSPLWLDMMAKNTDTSLEYKIPLILEEIGTLNMAPYEDYFRNAIRTRGDTMSGALFSVALDTFLAGGNKEGAQLALDLAKKRPFLAPYTRSPLEREQRRNAGRHPKPPGTVPSPAPAQAGDPQAPRKASEAQPASVPPVDPQSAEKAHGAKPVQVTRPEEPGASKLRAAVAVAVVLIMAVPGLWWLLRQRRPK